MSKRANWPLNLLPCCSKKSYALVPVPDASAFHCHCASNRCLSNKAEPTERLLEVRTVRCLWLIFKWEIPVIRSDPERPGSG